MVDIFALVLPEKVAEEVVRKDVKLTYDPATDELVQIVMPFVTKTEVTTLTVDKGWITEASVEDVKLLPGVRRTMFRLQGGEWVAHEIVQDVQSGRAKFVLTTGDMVWWGKQGPTPSENPYWKLVYEDVLKRLPPPDNEMRAANLPRGAVVAVYDRSGNVIATNNKDVGTTIAKAAISSGANNDVSSAIDNRGDLWRFGNASLMGNSIFVASSSLVGSRPNSCTRLRELRISLLMVSIMWTGMRIVRA